MEPVVHSPGGEGGTGRHAVPVGGRGGRDGAGGAQVPAARAASLCEADGNLCSARNGRSSDRRRLAQPLTTSPGRWLPPGARTHGEPGETLVSLLALLQVSVLQDQGDRVVLGTGEVTALCMKQPFHPCVQVDCECVGVLSGSMGRYAHPDRQTHTHTPTLGSAAGSHFLCWWLSLKGAPCGGLQVGALGDAGHDDAVITAC